MIGKKGAGLVALALLTVASNTAFASTWEELFSAKSGEIEAKVELDRYSLREQLVRGDKEITARIRTFYRESEVTSQAISDYEIHCADREVFRSNFEMTIEDSDRAVSTIKTAAKTALEGQDYLDF
ncbi:MAG: hypothetical protein AAFY15_07870, partial [Cyanobacteria bacterium J06648_11]